MSNSEIIEQHKMAISDLNSALTSLLDASQGLYKLMLEDYASAVYDLTDIDEVKALSKVVKFTISEIRKKMQIIMATQLEFEIASINRKTGRIAS